MPLFSASPFAVIRLCNPHTPEYVWGTYNDKISPTLIYVTNVALTTNVATLTVAVYSGNIPAVGSFITVTGTQTSSGVFNVTNVALTGVTINATTGIGTVTFALTNANISSTPDAGVAEVPTPVVREAVTVGTASVPVALPSFGSRIALTGFSFEATWSAAPSAAVIAVQIANVDPWIATNFVTQSTLTFSGTQTTMRYDPAGLTPIFVRGLLVSHTGSETLSGSVTFQ